MGNGYDIYPPEEFIGTYGWFKYKSSPSFGRINSIIQSSIESKDGTFAVLFYIDPTFNKEDSIYAITNKNFKIDLDRRHLNFIKNTSGVKSIRYYPHGYAQAKFNADTAMVFDVDMRREILSEEHLFGKYRKCKGFLLQKKDRGYIAMFCFYNKDKYWRKNEEIVKNLFKYN